MASDRLYSGKTRSCGCLQRETVARRNFKHGHGGLGGGFGTPTHRIWRSMIDRCHNPKSRDYPDYGGRGIVVCDHWRENFVNFLTDMGERPEGRSIDRIDNDDDYEPGNCRWATSTEQAQNRRKRRVASEP